MPAHYLLTLLLMVLAVEVVCRIFLGASAVQLALDAVRSIFEPDR